MDSGLIGQYQHLILISDQTGPSSNHDIADSIYYIDTLRLFTLMQQSKDRTVYYSTWADPNINIIYLLNTLFA